MGLPLLSRRRVIAVKHETTPGTAIAIGAADGAMNAYDARFRHEVPWAELEAQGTATSHAGTTLTRASELTFKHRLVGNGAAGLPAYATTLFPLCGVIASSQVFGPVTANTNHKNGTFGIYQDGRLKSGVGGAGSFVMRASAGGPAELEFRLLGKYAAPTPTAIIAPALPTVKAPRTAGATFTIGGTSFKWKDFEFDPGIKVVLIEDETDDTGWHLAAVVNRKPTIKINPLALALGTKDWFADHVAHAEAALQLVLGSTANNTMTLDAAKVQLMDAPEDQEDDDYLRDQLTFQVNGPGDGEWTLTYS